jgi:hypothetical protein
VLSAIAIVPSPPVMVPELARGAAAELADLRDAVFAAAGALPDRWVAIGAGPCDDVVGPRAVGTFAGFGADVRVTLGPGADGMPARLPLCALIAGWVRAQVSPLARVEVRSYAEDHGVDASLVLGRGLRAEVDAIVDDVGVLVVADGANTLTPTAPGGFDPESVAEQAALDDALAAGDVAALTRLGSGILGRVAYQVLAGLAGSAPRSAGELYRGAPYGVGYFVGTWQP